jgi:excisionase family DNA binding protein
MNVKATAQRMEMSKSLVYKLCQEGRLPHTRIGQQGKRGAIRISEEDLRAFLAGAKKERA